MAYFIYDIVHSPPVLFCNWQIISLMYLNILAWMAHRYVVYLKQTPLNMGVYLNYFGSLNQPISSTKSSLSCSLCGYLVKFD